MTAGPNIQHKPTFKSEAGFAFENGAMVRVVQPDTDGPAEAAPAFALSAEQLLSVMVTGASNTAEMGVRAVTLAMLMGIPEAPKSVADLARTLGVSHNTAKARLQSLSLYFQACLASSLKSSPIGDE